MQNIIFKRHSSWLRILCAVLPWTHVNRLALFNQHIVWIGKVLSLFPGIFKINLKLLKKFGAPII